MRVLSNPRYGSPVSGLRAVRDAVKRLLSSKDHEFWPDDVSIADDGLFNVAGMVGHRQITDVYLLGLARKRNGHLVTLDRSIPLRAVVGADAGSLTVIEPARERVEGLPLRGEPRRLRHPARLLEVPALVGDDHCATRRARCR